MSFHGQIMLVSEVDAAALRISTSSGSNYNGARVTSKQQPRVWEMVNLRLDP